MTRKFNNLTTKKKMRRIAYAIGDFFRYRVWGHYNGGVKGVWYWIRTHTYNRYHIIDIRGADGEYKWGWIDRDHAMFLACFKLLTEFVERETPEIGINETPLETYGVEDGDESLEYIKAQIARHEEVRALYDWWKTGRKKEHDECAALADKLPEPVGLRYSGPKWDEWRKKEEELEQKDEDMLMRLMAIRRSLWT